MGHEYDTQAVERKWRQRWEDAGLYDVDRGEADDRKFFIHFAYPGISGYLHVGHMRGFSYADVFARYKRMTGHRVFYPAGFHASGIPSVGLARRVERGDEATLDYLRANGCPEDEIPKLKDPARVVEYFSHVYRDEYWKPFGFLIDWDSLCTTIDPGYQRFIQWQFRRLKDADLLTQKPHYGPFCPTDGAVAVDPSETDISQGGGAEVKEFVNVLFRGPGGEVLPCATLRPETVYGVTNLWIDPDGQYVKVRVGDDAWVVGADAAEKIRRQRPDVADDAEPVDAKTLLSWKATNPLTGDEVPLLAGPFVDPAIGTGVVMSVPAHAPYDWQALADLDMPVDPVVIIEVPDVTGVPAEEAAKAHGVTSQSDEEALDAATDDVYGAEFAKGRMSDACGDVAGLPVRQAKPRVQELLADADDGGMTYEFSEPVICRCGQPVMIRRIPDQWFIKYSDATLTETSKRHARDMSIYPEEYHNDMPNVLDWFGDRACIRRGSWLGTPFPFDEEWIVEPISDSTLYSAYYVVSPYVNAGELNPEDLTDAFFDYVFFGQGDPADDVWREVRKDFEFWYPVDINLGGKEHKTVHFPVYVMNHVALLPQDAWPRGIFVNWWVTQKAGEKISKSKGGAEPIPGAAEKYGVDGMRLYYANVASAHVDIEWDAEVVMANRQRVERIYDVVTQLAAGDGEASPIDDWLVEAWDRRVNAARDAFESYNLRAATQVLYYDVYNDLQWYRRRGGTGSARVQHVLKGWAAALAPVTPFVAEELWEALGGDGLASTASFPTSSGKDTVGEATEREAYLRQVLDDLTTVRRVVGIDDPETIHLYTAPAWKYEVHAHVRSALEQGNRDVGTLIQQVLAKDAVRPHKKQAPALVQRLVKNPPTDDAIVGPDAEREALTAAADFLASELGGATVHVHAADDADAPDPGGKKDAAQPSKPAIYMA